MLIAQQSTGGIRHAISLPDDQDHATSVPTSLKTAPAVKTISEMVADLKSAMAPYNGATVTEMIAKTSNAFAPYGGKTCRRRRESRPMERRHGGAAGGVKSGHW
jgi:hypothetical protein